MDILIVCSRFICRFFWLQVLQEGLENEQQFFNVGNVLGFQPLQIPLQILRQLRVCL